MKTILQKLTLCAALLIQTVPLAPLSMVYNLRVAQITKQPLTKQSRNKSYNLLSLAFDQYRKKYNGIEQNFLGGFGTFIYIFKPFYCRIDGAFAYIKEQNNHTTTFSGTATDDILCTLGRQFSANKKIDITVSGFFGFPTHKNFNLQRVDFGIGQIGTGFQVESAYAATPTSSLLFGTRLLYFIPTNVRGILNKKYNFTIGNIADFLCAYRSTLNNHGLEFGYTARFGFGSKLSPDPNDISSKANFISSSFYGVYKYKFLINRIINGITLSASYGFDHTPKIYGNKHIITILASWNISF